MVKSGFVGRAVPIALLHRAEREGEITVGVTKRTEPYRDPGIGSATAPSESGKPVTVTSIRSEDLAVPESERIHARSEEGPVVVTDNREDLAVPESQRVHARSEKGPTTSSVQPAGAETKARPKAKNKARRPAKNKADDEQ